MDRYRLPQRHVSAQRHSPAARQAGPHWQVVAGRGAGGWQPQVHWEPEQDWQVQAFD